MRAVDIIQRKRDGFELDTEEIKFFISDYVAGKIPDYQVSAWAMAVFFRGMTARETGALTEAMLHSGKRISRGGAEARGIYIDKHSTGGVGDKTSLILAPLIAALGEQRWLSLSKPPAPVYVPMMSGRALGITGGTLDKLESIAGYSTALSEEAIFEGLEKNGYIMCGQTADIAPADRLLYSLRDVTATVESIPLITASILSKKAAEGAQFLVMDVKYGSGAFMKKQADAEALAKSLVDTGEVLGLKVSAILNSMDEPLGRAVGNWLEVEECLDFLENYKTAGTSSCIEPDLQKVTLDLAARMAVLAGLAADDAEGRELCEKCLETGAPFKKFLTNVALQGGNPDDMLARRQNKWRSPYKAELKAERAGQIVRIDAGKVGHASVALGVGRNRKEDSVCPTAGIIFHKKSGSSVQAGDTIMEVYGKDEACLQIALPELRDAIEYKAE
ncbi:MAG: thymidine phosphorylase [Spirochaetaceae bacterium]|jgi:pyrimidine-nucleoside phosphorylase|nr:thymidine phosphorylase [Spirochaetaceae bacterium]